MLRNWRSLGLIILALIGLGYIGWIISGSQSFQSCFIDREHANSYIALSESDNLVLTSLLRVRLNIECVLTVLRNYSDAITVLGAAITAIATFFIALYASTVSNTLRALRGAADKQQENMMEYLKFAGETASAAKKSADAAAKNLIFASRPLIEIRHLSLEDAPNEGSPYIHFQCRNIGKGACIVNKIIATTSTAHQTTSLVPIATVSSGKMSSVIEPGATIRIGPIYSPDLYDTKIAKIRSGDINLHVIIQIFFSDIFGNQYDQRFPYVFEGAQGNFNVDVRFVEAK
jgi:hypothetical protein